MTKYSALPLPVLRKRTVGPITMHTDDALASSVGVYMGFTERMGGVSKTPYNSLNFGGHVDDDPAAVLQNRQILMGALGFPGAPVIVPKQVHETTILDIDSSASGDVELKQEQASAGADALIVSTSGVGAVLCFADCAPVIAVSPTGRTAVVHAGWRGAYAGILGKSIQALSQLDAEVLHVSAEEVASQINMYIGPYIHVECFEVDEETASQFAERYGDSVVSLYEGTPHVDLGAVLRVDAARAAVTQERIADLCACTVCSPESFFSFRGSGGVCGRHGAFAIRKEV